MQSAAVQLGAFTVFSIAELASGQQRLLASNYNAHRVVSIDAQSGEVTTFATGGTLKWPDGLTLHVSGDLLVADGLNENGRVLRFDGQSGAFKSVFCSPQHGRVQAVTTGPDGDVFTVSWFDTGVRRWRGSDGASQGVFASSALLNKPVAIEFGPDGHLYVQGTQSGNVVRFNGASGEFIDVIAPKNTGGMTSCEGMTFGPDGNLYVGAGNLSAVLRFNIKTGAYLGIFAQADSGGSQSVTFGCNGSLYLGQFNGRLLEFDGATGQFLREVVTVANNLSEGLLSSPQRARIAGSPQDTAMCPHSDAAFAVVPYGQGPFTISWELMSDDGEWIKVSDGPVIATGGYCGWLSGTESTQLVWHDAVSPIASSLPLRLRAVVSNSCGAASSLEAIATLCPPDFDCSGFVDTDDFTAFLVAFEAGTEDADFDGSGFVDTDDFTAFVLAFGSGC